MTRQLSWEDGLEESGVDRPRDSSKMSPCLSRTWTYDSVPLGLSHDDTLDTDSDEEDNFSLLPSDDLTTRSARRSIFENAANYVNPGRFFQFLTLLYSERKLVVVILIHFICTMVIWCNFFLIKFDQMKEKVPEDANRYWWKRLAPPLEFGAMHAILFQMAIIPLTMCRLTIATASNTGLNRFIPFNRSLRIHIHLGYTWAIIVLLGVVLFFAFFGLLCIDGEEGFCAKFTSEIMITGYVILVTCVVIVLSSRFRDYIPYEVFYALHHIVFLMYAVTILHTLDAAARNGQSRSQTFKWFSAPLVYYISDRLAMHINHRYSTRVTSSKLVEGTASRTKMIILKIRRPALFQFEPGQSAYLKFPDIDMHWHPFAIASDPGSPFLEFYVGVQDEKSWTGKMWDLLGAVHHGNLKNEPNLTPGLSFRRFHGETGVKVEVMGPCGTSLGKTEEYSHAIAIGTGTGVVPILSLYKKHIRQLLRLDPQTYFSEQEALHKRIVKMEKAKQKVKGSLCQKATGLKASPTKQEMERLSDKLDNENGFSALAQSKMELRDIEKAAKKASLPIYGMSILLLLPVLGCGIIGLTISWNGLPFDLYNGMVEVLQVGTIAFQFCYMVVAFCFWDKNSLFMYLDVAVVIGSALTDWYRFSQNKWGAFSTNSYIHYVLLHGYMVARLWNSAVKPRHCSARNEVVRNGIVAMDKLHFIWVTRSATNVSKIAPDIIEYWDSLIDAWGHTNTFKACQVSFYITDKDEIACSLLRKELAHTSLYRAGAFHFERPNFQEILEEHALERISNRDRPTSCSLLAFCGSRSVSSVILKAKINVDISTMITGNKYHQMAFISECHGTFKSHPKTKTQTEAAENHIEGSQEFAFQCETDKGWKSQAKKGSSRAMI